MAVRGTGKSSRKYRQRAGRDVGRDVRERDGTERGLALALGTCKKNIALGTRHAMSTKLALALGTLLGIQSDS